MIGVFSVRHFHDLFLGFGRRFGGIGHRRNNRRPWCLQSRCCLGTLLSSRRLDGTAAVLRQVLQEDAIDAEFVFAELMATAPPGELNGPACALVDDADRFVGQALILTPLVVHQVVAKRRYQIRLASLKWHSFLRDYFQSFSVIGKYLLVKGEDLAIDCQIDNEVVGVPAARPQLQLSLMHQLEIGATTGKTTRVSLTTKNDPLITYCMSPYQSLNSKS